MKFNLKENTVGPFNAEVLNISAISIFINISEVTVIMYGIALWSVHVAEGTIPESAQRDQATTTASQVSRVHNNLTVLCIDSVCALVVECG